MAHAKDRDGPAEGADGGPSGGVLRTFATSVVAVVLVLAVLLSPRLAGEDDPGPYPVDSLEHRLAEDDGVAPAEAELRRYSEALELVRRRCTEPVERLAASATRARTELQDRGARVISREVLVAVARDGRARGGCDGAVAEAVQRLARCEPQGARACGY